MKQDKNRGAQKDSNNNGNQQQQPTTRDSKQGKDTGGIYEDDNAPSGEKKPISHKTGDATNFGERSYRED